MINHQHHQFNQLTIIMSSSSTSDGPSELFPIRNHLYLGNYSSAIEKAQQMSSSGSGATENQTLKNQRDALMYRAYIGLGELDTVIAQIKDSEATPAILRVC